MNKLVERWKTKEGDKMLEKILNCLERGVPLSKVKYLEKYVGRWDLRGAKLSKSHHERIIEANNLKLKQNFGTLVLRDVLVENIDFSYSDISYSSWDRCTIKNCIFEKTKARNIEVTASHFIGVIFRKSNLSQSFLGRNIGADSGSYINTEFIETNLSKAFFYFPRIENCIFSNCNLKETNFDGSRFINTKFIGELHSLWFSGYSSLAQKSTLGIFNRVNPRDYPNEMKNVDFTESKLIGVVFKNAIDISECLFPKDENYILIKNIHSTYKKAIKIIENEWEGENRRIGIDMINGVCYGEDHRQQEMDLLDKHILLEACISIEFADKFYRLIKMANVSDLELYRS
jgi:uncharacterized protein YjbI with pentapeptide repeats